jgi:cytochrome c
MNRCIQVVIALFVLTTIATAGGVVSKEQGEKLFKSTSLGSNGRSCAGCHPDGKGLENAAAYDEKTLAKIANKCIVKALNGKALADDSTELASLIMYLKTIAAAKPK